MTTQPTRGQRTQERIEQVTLALFAEKGVDRTTIGDIARAAGIAEGTIYRHYPSKEELVWQLFSRNYTGLAQQLDALQAARRSEEHTSALQSLMRISYDVFCLKKNNTTTHASKK